MNIKDFEVENGYVKIPVSVFEDMRERLEDLADAAAFESAWAQDEEAFPLEIVKRITGGESPLRVLREYRGMTQLELAEKTALSQAQISQMESGARKGSLKNWKTLAEALDVDVDDLV